MTKILKNYNFIIRLNCIFKQFLFKSKIIDSEAYRNYLLHKDINEHKSREIDAKLSVREVDKRLAVSRYEKDKINQVETLHKWTDIIKADLKLELEETKRKYEEDIAEIPLRIKLLLKYIK